MNAPQEFPARIAESRAKHLSPGLGAVWIGRNGTIETAAHGRLSDADSRPATRNHLWHIGSCTKAMTATLLARLIERGLARFDMTLGEALPDLALKMSPEFRDTPLSAVLTHSAGIARDPQNSTFRALRRSGAPAAAQRKFLASEALRAFPNPQIGYSNLGYIILGAVIERALGIPWEAALAREVMIPLGIGRFGFGPPGSSHPAGHQRRKGGWRVERGDNPEAYGPAGRAHLALDEWGRFLRVHIGHGPEGFLQPDTLRTLHTPLQGGFAMGWIAARRADGLRLLHTGSNTAWFSQVVLVPSRGVGVGIVCNSYSEDVAKAVDDLSGALLDASPDVGP